MSRFMVTWRPFLLGLAQTGLATAAMLLLGRAIDSPASQTAPLIAAALGLAAALGVVAWHSTRADSRTQITLEHDERHGIVQAVFDLGPRQRTREATGTLVSTATDAVERSAQYRATFKGSMFGSLAAPVLVAAVIAVALDVRSGLLLLAALPLIPLIVGGFRKAFSSVSTRYRAAAKRFSAAFLDALQGLPTLRALGAGGRHGDVLAAHAEQVRRGVMRMLLGNQLVLLVSDAVFSLAMIVLATWLAAVGYREQTFTLGAAVSLVLLATLMTEPLDRIGQFFYIGMGGIASTKEIRRFHTGAALATTSRVGIGAAALPTASASASAPGAIVLDGVDFSYETSDGQARPILRGLSLQVKAGERVVLAGPSGAGKSTILALVQGFHTPQAGAISVDGVAPHAARARVATVAQSTYLFSGTLADNLRLAKPDATDTELWDALDQARLAQEARTWPLGLDTPVGERGLELSGGQAQRVSIARALLADTPILLLDEPTSQTDLTTEAELLDAIAAACEGRTVLAVGHREAMVAAATRVVTVTPLAPDTAPAPLEPALAGGVA